MTVLLFPRVVNSLSRAVREIDLKSLARMSGESCCALRERETEGV